MKRLRLLPALLLLLAFSVCVPAQEVKLETPDPVPDALWQQFVADLKAQPTYPRYGALRQDAIEPKLAAWQKQFNILLAPEWQDFITDGGSFKTHGGGIETDWHVSLQAGALGEDSIWTVRRGSKLSATTYSVSADKMAAVNFSYLAKLSQASSFETVLPKLQATGAADSLIMNICAQLDSDFALPADGAKVNIRLRNVTARDAVQRIASAAGWTVGITDGLGEDSVSWTASAVAKQADLRRQANPGMTVEDSMLQQLEWQVANEHIEVDPEDLMVQASPK